MEVKINKEIRDYQESMFFGLNLRQFVCSLLAILTAVGIYFSLRDVAGQEATGWLCMLGAAPFAACGFFKYHGMTAEQFLWALLKSEMLYPKRLTFRPENLYYDSLAEKISAGERKGRTGKGIPGRKRRKKRRRRKGRRRAVSGQAGKRTERMQHTRKRRKASGRSRKVMSRTTVRRRRNTID